MKETWARILFLIAGLNSLVGLGIGIITASQATPEEVASAAGSIADPAMFASAFARGFNQLYYFTFQSNLVLGIVCILLAIKWQRNSTVFRVFRIISLGGIIITGIVYNAVLAATLNPEGWSKVSTTMVHIIAPILAVVLWLIFGPRIPLRIKYVGLSLLFGVWWLGLTLIRGSLTNWYPYGFINVDTKGMTSVIITCLAIVVFYVIIVLVILALDKVLPGEKESADSVSAKESQPSA